MNKNINELVVASVLNSTQVVLNAGGNDGVLQGMSYVIYSQGPDIVDPLTGVGLGALELVRGRVWVHHIQEKFCVASVNQKASKIEEDSTFSFLMTGVPTLSGAKVGDLAKRVS